METRVINLSQSVHDICTRYPEIRELMMNIGFAELKNPALLQTSGRFMTIPKGAKMKNIDLETIKQHIRDLGFQVQDGDNDQ